MNERLQPSCADREIPHACRKARSPWKQQENKRRYAAVLSLMEDGVITTDIQSRINFMNPAAGALTGWSKEDAVARPLHEVFRTFDEETGQPRENSMSLALRLGKVVHIDRPPVLRRSDGSEVSIIERGCPMMDRHGRVTGGVLIFRDVTTGKKQQAALSAAQASLTHACRVNTMGKLAASIAHEVNQPLGGVLANGAACLKWLSKLTGDSAALEEMKEALDHLLRDAKRAGAIVARTRALFESAAPVAGPVKLHASIGHVIVLLRHALAKSGVSLQLNLDPDSPQVHGDAVQIEQVMLNLISNGMEAIEAGGSSLREIRIHTKNIDRDWVSIEVRDSGIGLDPGKNESIFEAFHTTKPRGIGMGLAISRSIVERHGGKLWAIANHGAGAAFRFTLPKHPGKNPHGSARPDSLNSSSNTLLRENRSTIDQVRLPRKQEARNLRVTSQ